MSGNSGDEKSIPEFLRQFSERPGLILGPDITMGGVTLAQMITDAIDSAKTQGFAWSYGEEEAWPNKLDRLQAGESEAGQRVERDLVSRLEKVEPDYRVTGLANVNWSACFSLTYDVAFEAALSTRLDEKASTRNVTVIESLWVRPDRKTIPVYKMLGSPTPFNEDGRLALRASELLRRQQAWPTLLQSAADFTRDGPLFVLGCAGVPALLQTLLTVLSTISPPRPTHLCFLTDDPVLEDPVVTSLLNSFQVTEFNCDITKLRAAIIDAAPKQGDLLENAFVASDEGKVSSAIHDFRDIVDPVPKEPLNRSAPKPSRQILLDALFSPTGLDWDPYHEEIDISRDVSPQLKQSLIAHLGGERIANASAFVLHGEAGVGKSTILKSVAASLARDGYRVLWAKRAESQSWTRRYQQLFSAIGQSLSEHDDRHLIVFVDDPWGGRIDPATLLNCAEGTDANIAIVFGLRDTDYFTSEGAGSQLRISGEKEFTVKNEFSASELTALVDFLVDNGICVERNTARERVASVESTHSADVLCGLWYLLPDTQYQLRESLRDEYRRLGEVQPAVDELANAVVRSGEVARKAYEYVTVTTKLDVPLPMEVLVRALRVNYDEWIDITGHGKPLWGLLYAIDDPGTESVVYRTRNHIVTKVLLELVNQGVGHSGELRVLRSLIKGCDDGSPIYRDFIVDILVRNRSKLEKIFSYDDGLDLYELARNTLPYEDRALEHQMGVWMRRGRYNRGAYEQLERALQTAEYPGSSQHEPLAHIHTSMAATILNLVETGEQDTTTGLEQIKAHLQQSESPSYFNAHAAHVSANTLFRMGQIAGEGDATGSMFEAYGEALREIESAFQTIGLRARRNQQYSGDVQALSELQRKILEGFPDNETLHEYARNALQNTGSQLGYVVLGRRALAEAATKDKKRDYNAVMRYLGDLMEEIGNAGHNVTANLLSIRVDLLVRWQVRRYSSQVQWEVLKSDLDRLLSDALYSQSIMKRFYYAVTLYQLGHISESHAEFQSIRAGASNSLDPGAIRCVYLGKEGQPKRLQALISERHSKYYANINEVQDSVRSTRPKDGVGDGSTTHVYLGFNMRGPLALFRLPEEQHIVLPRGSSEVS